MTRAFLWIALAVLPQTVSVSGVVIDAGSKEPVAGARILLARVDGSAAASLVVDADERGRFTARGVPPGTYRLSAHEPGFLRKDHDQPIVVAAGGAVTPVTIALTRTAVIAGRVVNDRGDPVSAIYVRAWTAAGRVTEARTNDLGEYRLFGLAPGAYVISAERYQGPRIEGTFYIGPTPPCPDCRGEGAFRQSVATLLTTGGYIDPRALSDRPYPAVYFPGTTDRTAATPVEVSAGAQVGGIDLRLVVR